MRHWPAAGAGAAASATGLLRALAHEDRLLLLCQLSQEELCVSDLEARLKIYQPSLSQQLGVLRKQGLVTTRREGKHIFYRIADARALALLQVLYQQFCIQPEGDTPLAQSPEYID
ncbi:ArsR family transcriptional regulator [Halomonas sp. DQ26W]|uniref:ArsR/SmtB family transcription factor n=1 Tax=Halomonas sp. DQ26W TaxID=2282311 RepID=UPI000DF788BF|nr:metalloregulator ArsR/SmtB family transcription factor [Halomonas sp. DQ26W]RDB42383.1 ArsR family transcriptional regulator [Halomonas sp. DQ26W]